MEKEGKREQEPHLTGIHQQLSHVLYAREVKGTVEGLVSFAVPRGEGGRRAEC